MVSRMNPDPPSGGDLNCLALVKGAERYVVLYEDARRSDAVRLLGRWAANPDLSFTWYDAAHLSNKIRPTPVDPSTGGF